MEISLNILILFGVLVSIFIALLEALSRCHEINADLLNPAKERDKTELKNQDLVNKVSLPKFFVTI
jgi:hypothetical protein